MPIRGLSEVRRCPRIGRLSLGEKRKSQKNGAEYPAETEWFTMVPATGDKDRDEKLVKQFKKLYGDKPKSIKVMFPPVSPDIFFQNFNKRYGTNLLQCKGDSETAKCSLPEYAKGLEVIGTDAMGLTEVVCRGKECPYQKGDEKLGIKAGSCKRIGTLQIILPEIDALGVWQITTSSFNSIVNLNSALDWLTGICGRYSMIPVNLVRIPTETAYIQDGKQKKSTHYCMQIDLNVSISEIQKLAMISPTQSMIALPPPDESPDPLLYTEQEPEEAVVVPAEPVLTPATAVTVEVVKATKEEPKKKPTKQQEDYI